VGDGVPCFAKLLEAAHDCFQTDIRALLWPSLGRAQNHVRVQEIAKRIEENQRRLHGVEAAMRNRNEWLDTWDEHGIDLEEVIEGGDGVVAVIHITATGKASGVETDVRFYAHIKMQDHQIVYIFDHSDRTTALKAVGLEG
jgi:hypothetical protein